MPLHQISSKEDQRRKIMIEDRYSVFFLESNNGIEYISEQNTKALYDIITNSKDLKLFWINSIYDYSNSPTSIAELIITCLKRNIIFHSESDNLYLDKHNQIASVYPKIFDLFKKKS